MLNYKRNLKEQDLKEYEYKYLQTKKYNVTSMYVQKEIKDIFLKLKANIVDLDTASITKCIQGTEQDFIQLMKKAELFLENYLNASDVINYTVMELFKDCVFGYYVLTPLIKAKEISDIKVYAWNKITCKANGGRYGDTDISFFSEDDYNKWMDRLMRIHHLNVNGRKSLQRCTDRRGVEDFYLRIDVQTPKITSSEDFNIHIRKIPKEKYTWEYLVEKGMLDYEMIDYIKDRIASGYSFLISGRGGSGKTSLVNNILDIVPYDQAVLVAQESDELYSDHPQMQFEHTLEEELNDGKKDVSLEDILRMGLLQDIDGFVIGEIKGGEALHVFTTAANTGAWFMATIHSNTARGSIRRMAFCAKFVADYSIETLEEMLSDSPIVLIHMGRFCIDEIVEVHGYDNEKESLNYVDVYQKYGRK